MYIGQAGIQNLLLAVAGIYVLVLLLAKPYFLSKDQSAHHHLAGDDDNEEEEHGMGEVIIYQVIETIEYLSWVWCPNGVLPPSFGSFTCALRTHHRVLGEGHAFHAQPQLVCHVPWLRIFLLARPLV